MFFLAAAWEKCQTEIFLEEMIKFFEENQTLNTAELYPHLVVTLRKKGFSYTTKQMQSKLDSLKRRYRVAAIHNESVEARKKNGENEELKKDNWPHFDVRERYLLKNDCIFTFIFKFKTKVVNFMLIIYRLWIRCSAKKYGRAKGKMFRLATCRRKVNRNVVSIVHNTGN